MKKIFYIAIFVLFSFVMIACDNHSFRLDINSASELRNAVVINYTIVDPNEELKSSNIKAEITKKEDSKVILSREIKYSKDKLTDDVKFSGLESSTEYTVKFTAGYEGKQITLATKDVKTGAEGNSVETPYLLKTAAEFTSMLKNDPDGHYKLANDIDFAGSSISPLFTNTTPFNGTFDGAGFTISNFVVGEEGKASTISYKYYGLFGYIGTNGAIKNVKLDAFKLYTLRSSSTTFVGLVAGYNAGLVENVTVTNSLINLEVSSSSSSNTTDSSGNLTGYYVGGIVGQNKNGGSLKNCNATLDILVKAKRGVVVGGICAINYDNSNYEKENVIDACKFNGKIDVMVANTSTAAYESTTCVGGVIGQNFYTVSNCEVSGTIELLSEFTTPSKLTYRVYCGGLVGWNVSDSALLKDSKVSANMKVTSKDALNLMVGLVAGQNGGTSATNYSKIANCSYTLPAEGKCEVNAYEQRAHIGLVGLDKNSAHSSYSSTSEFNITVNLYHKVKDAENKEVLELKETSNVNIK